MEEKLISFETAKLAKEKGFDWKVISSYRDGENYKQDLIKGGSLYNMNSLEEQHLWKCKLYSAPTQSLLQKWLRDEHNLIVDVAFYDFNAWSYSIWNPTHQGNSKPTFKTYEDALEKGLQEALKLIIQCK